MPELTNFTVSDTSNIGKLTVLTIDIPTLPSPFSDTNQGVFTKTADVFHKELTISIDRLGLAEVFSADIITLCDTINKPSSVVLTDDIDNIHSRNTNQNLDLVGLNHQNKSINIEPLVFIDSEETKLIITNSFATPYFEVNLNSDKEARLTVIGRRK